MAYLPGEVLEEILSKLPVESVLRFKCVCKSWYALFKNPKFVAKHMSNQINGYAILQGWCSDRGVNVFSFLSNDDHGGDNGFLYKDLDSKWPFRPSLRMHGHCNGIVALSYSDDVILCNPTIREFKILPKYNFFPWTYNTYMPMDLTWDVGFGYDPKSNDYKVVRIAAFLEGQNFCKAEVFSLRADSMWREIKNAFGGIDLFYGLDLEQFFDGVYYWIGKDRVMEELVLVSFNMANEEFSKAPLPDICQYQYTSSLESGFTYKNMTQLGAFDNKSIALFVHPNDEFETCIDVWVMKEFGLKKSWSKQLSIGPLQGLVRPLMFWKNGKELLHQDFSEQIISYNLTTLECKNVTIHRGGLQKKKNTPRIVWNASTYMKTLISVNTNEDIAPSDK